jgi:hypothetical protein
VLQVWQELVPLEVMQLATPPLETHAPAEVGLRTAVALNNVTVYNTGVFSDLQRMASHTLTEEIE